MALGDIGTLKSLLNITDGSQDTYLTTLLSVADGAVRRYIKRTVVEQAIATEYHDGQSAVDLPLLNRPVVLYDFTGNLTAGSATIAVASGSTSGLLAGMPVVSQAAGNPGGTNLIPNNATVSSFTSNSVTMSLPAAGTATASPFCCGLAVWYDPFGYAGDNAAEQPSGPFGPATLLVPGRDVLLLRDQPDGITSMSGIVRRIGVAAGFGWWPGPGYGGGGAWGGGGNRGGLTAVLDPCWPQTWKGIKCVSAQGFSTVPPELSFAATMLGAWLYRNGPFGGNAALSSESYEGYSYAVGKLSEAPELGSLKQLLSRYREVSFGSV